MQNIFCLLDKNEKINAIIKYLSNNKDFIEFLSKEYNDFLNLEINENNPYFIFDGDIYKFKFINNGFIYCHYLTIDKYKINDKKVKIAEALIENPFDVHRISLKHCSKIKSKDFKLYQIKENSYFLNGKKKKNPDIYFSFTEPDKNNKNIIEYTTIERI